MIVGRNRIIYREIKTENGVVTDAQLKWGGAILAAGGDWGVWRPEDMDNLTIKETLQ